MIYVKFKQRQDLIFYTKEILNLLLTDNEVEFIVDCDTGEYLRWSNKK